MGRELGRWAALFDGGGDGGEDGGEVVEDLVVAEADEVIAVLGEDIGSGLVLLGLVIMVRAIDFDREPGGWAVKVEDERSDAVLAPKADTVPGPTPEHPPENVFGRRHPLPQIAGRGVQAPRRPPDAARTRFPPHR